MFASGRNVEGIYPREIEPYDPEGPQKYAIMPGLSSALQWKMASERRHFKEEDPMIFAQRRALLVFRPNVGKQTREKVLEILRHRGFCIHGETVLPFDKADLRRRAEMEYEDKKGEDFFCPLVEFMSSGPVHIFEIGKNGAVPAWKDLKLLLGATDPAKAEEGTIRGQFGNKRGIYRENVAHGPDSWEATVRSARIWMDVEWPTPEKTEIP